MILVDTSVWVDRLRGHGPTRAGRLEDDAVLGHTFLLGEIACGNLARRAVILAQLADLSQALVAADGEVLGLIERHWLMNCGIGYVDALLLASTLLTPDTSPWTRDRRLAEVAGKLGVAGGG